MRQNCRYTGSRIQAHRRNLVALLLALAPPIPVYAQQCPAVDTTQGYPLTVSWAAGSGPDSTWMAEFGRAAAYRWQTPSRRRGDYRGWREVRERTLPPEPRWADDWSPTALHRAEMAVTVHADGRLHAGAPGPASGDPFFDRSLPTIVNEPMPGSPKPPAWPYGMASDSVVLLLSFGLEDVAGPHAVVRFAAQQSPVRLRPGTLRVSAPRTPQVPASLPRRATVKYDVTEDGLVAAGSVQVVESSDRALTRAIQDALPAARFEPAQSNCRPIRMSVMQTFEY